jgi:UDP-N-acetylglucosamine--N-acetylmuramyl-(pentapeptide) pyrophosphoryl-undecaprenol N-acetylglucosamine transferase
MSLFVLMAGGTGGHLFPAMALAQELRRRGHQVELMTDPRVAAYGDRFPARETHVIPSATPSVRNPLRFLKAGFTIVYGIGLAYLKFGSVKADAVVGFGGYPVFPPFIAARLRGIPGVLHEQNAVMGRANRALGRLAAAIGLSFADTKKADGLAAKCVVVGNPVRDRVRAVVAAPYPALTADGPLRVLVFGGSQGASVFSRIVPPAIQLLPEALRARLVLVQQVRAEDMDQVAAAYRAAKVNVELAPFFDDLPERIAKAHLVIGRSGASSIAELCALGRPALLVPLPGALDADQKSNAEVMARAGAAEILEQATLSPDLLATRLLSRLGDAAGLAAAAEAARTLGRPDAVTLLADLAERVAGKGRSE